MKGMNAQIKGVAQLPSCHINHSRILLGCLLPFVKGKFLPSQLRPTTQCEHLSSISAQSKGFILSRCLVSMFECPLNTDPESNLPVGLGMSKAVMATGMS